MRRSRKQASERGRTKKRTGSSSTRSRKKVVTAAALSMAFVLEAAPGCGSDNKPIPVVAPTDARVEQVVGRDANPIMPPRDMRDVAIMPPREAGRTDGVGPDHRPDMRRDGPKIYPIIAPKFDKGQGKHDGPIIYPIIAPNWDAKIYPIIAPKFDKGTPKKG
jgi:hypothetical protein